MSNLFPIGNSTLLSNNGLRGVQNPAPIIVAEIPLALINGTTYPFTSMAQNFSAIAAAIAAGASFTLIAASASQRWLLQMLRIQASAAGVMEIQDNAVSIGFFSVPITTQFLPFGDLVNPLLSNNVGTALTIKNTSAAVCTYTITCFAQYITN